MGYSLSQNAYLCFELKAHHLYHSRYILFDEGRFPFFELCPNTSETTNAASSSPQIDPLVFLSLPTNQAQFAPATISQELGTHHSLAPLMETSPPPIPHQVWVSQSSTSVSNEVSLPNISPNSNPVVS